jgi:hypothetical protein
LLAAVEAVGLMAMALRVLVELAAVETVAAVITVTE